MNDRVMTVSVDERGTLHTTLMGNIDTSRVQMLEQDVHNAKAIIREEFQKRGIKFKSLINLSEFGGTYVPAAMMILADYMKANKPYVAKSAGFGGGATTSLAGNIVATIAGRDNIKFFQAREAAEAWLAQ